jgi:hypothetical protein
MDDRNPAPALEPRRYPGPVFRAFHGALAVLMAVLISKAIGRAIQEDEVAEAIAHGLLGAAIIFYYARMAVAPREWVAAERAKLRQPVSVWRAVAMIALFLAAFFGFAYVPMDYEGEVLLVVVVASLLWATYVEIRESRHATTRGC